MLLFIINIGKYIVNIWLYMIPRTIASDFNGLER